MNWNALHPLNEKHCLIYLLNVNLKRLWNKIVFVASWPWPCIAQPIYLLEKRKKMNPTIEMGKILILVIILGARPTSTSSPKRNQLVQWRWAIKTLIWNVLMKEACQMKESKIVEVGLNFFPFFPLVSGTCHPIWGPYGGKKTTCYILCVHLMYPILLIKLLNFDLKWILNYISCHPLSKKHLLEFRIVKRLPPRKNSF